LSNCFSIIAFIFALAMSTFYIRNNCLHIIYSTNTHSHMHAYTHILKHTSILHNCYLVTIFVLCSLSIVVKKKKKIVAYRFIFGFLASPADELWHQAILESWAVLWKFFGKFILWA